MARHTARMTATVRRLGVAGLLAFVVALPPCPAFAQGQKMEFTRERRFWIPFEADGAVQRLRQVELYYSADQGQRWHHVQTVPPNQRGFWFSAEREGVYWLTARTVDFEGRGSPATLEGQPPQIVVCVDTTPPVVRLSPLSPQGGVGVEWQVSDDHLDLSTLRLEYRAPGSSVWQPLQIEAVASGQRAWQGGAGVIDELRLQVQDKAKNVGEAHLSLSGRRTDTRPYPAGAPPVGQAPPPTRIVNSTRITINYRVDDVGASGVTLELWWTRDQGRTWEKVQDQLPAKPPCVVTAPGEGVYGFTLVARSGVNLGDRPPQPGEPPQIWVEVDLKPPTVRFTSPVEVGRGPDANKMTIRWSATDKNLDAQPVKLEYAEDKNGQWREIVANQPGDGQYVWTVPADGVRYYVRATARDRAGNVGSAETPQPVVVDLSRPRGIILDIGPAQGGTSGGLAPEPGNAITIPRPGGGGP